MQYLDKVIVQSGPSAGRRGTVERDLGGVYTVRLDGDEAGRLHVYAAAQLAAVEGEEVAT
jgi:hypothetical protein